MEKFSQDWASGTAHWPQDWQFSVVGLGEMIKMIQNVAVFDCIGCMLCLLHPRKSQFL
jgi:hypothetical protein